RDAGCVQNPLGSLDGAEPEPRSRIGGLDTVDLIQIEHREVPQDTDLLGFELAVCVDLAGILFESLVEHSGCTTRFLANLAAHGLGLAVREPVAGTKAVREL